MDSPSIKLLHISDLHFSSAGARETADIKKNAPIAGDDPDIHGDAAAEFVVRLERELTAVPGDQRPEILVVTGDVVNRGGADAGEFEKAAAFLRDLANRVLSIPLKHVLVVPGNHDVLWEPDITQAERFENFESSMREFTIPHFNADGPDPVVLPLTNVREGIDLEIYLLISPTFSGVVDDEAKSLFDRLRRLLQHLPDSELERLKESFLRVEGPVDIAAIGSRQRARLLNLVHAQAHPDPIRIALLHHHLLPHPQVEVTNFEAVVDSGAVLEDLIENGFDLVLSGHKHNRRLVTLSAADKMIDVYTASSLFCSSKHGRPGFSIVEVLGPQSPHYARIHHHATRDCKATETRNLTREGRIQPAVLSQVGTIAHEEQTTHVLPVIEAVGKALRWSRRSAATEVFETAWQAMKGDFENLGAGRLIFRPPYLLDAWGKLLAIAQESDAPSLRFVSDNDLDYWVQARKERTNAWYYAQPIFEFRGQKERILVLDPANLAKAEYAATVVSVVGEMIREQGFTVSIADKTAVPILDPPVLLDFGIVGDLSVSEFHSRSAADPARLLIEDFGHERMERAERDYQTLCSEALWQSDDSRNVREWLNQEFDLELTDDAGPTS